VPPYEKHRERIWNRPWKRGSGKTRLSKYSSQPRGCSTDRSSDRKWREKEKGWKLRNSRYLSGQKRLKNDIKVNKKEEGK